MKKTIIIGIIIIIIGICYYYQNSLPNNKEEASTVKKTTQVKLQDKEIANSIFKSSYKKALKQVEKMTIEEKIGQLFLVRYESSLTNEYQKYYPGGYIMFAKDFENHTKKSIKEELIKLQNNSQLPLIIGVDEEGGFVTRISRFKEFRNEKFKSPKAYYEEGGYELLENIEKEKAKLLKELGINLNLAPVADISTNPNDFIYTRSFGEDASKTSEYISKMVEYANQNQINSCLKHFPGYGNNVDTHTGIAIDERSYETFLENDFLPFKAGIKAGVPSILVSHNIMKCIDENYPSSLSNKVISLLRKELKFTGIIITDDLAMDAVKEYVENGSAATLAIKAGNDMIITSDFITMYNEILEEVKEKKLEEEIINKAVLRIIAWKYESNLWEGEENG